MVQERVLRSDGDIRCVLTALSLLALLATFALPVLGPRLAAYAPEHGHVTLAGHVPANHLHPWDSEAGAQPADSAAQESEGVMFTLATDGDAASGWASATLVPEPVALSAAALILVDASEVDKAPVTAPAAAPSPPPRI